MGNTPINDLLNKLEDRSHCPTKHDLFVHLIGRAPLKTEGTRQEQTLPGRAQSRSEVNSRTSHQKKKQKRVDGSLLFSGYL